MSNAEDKEPTRKRIMQLPGQAWRWFSDSWAISDVYVRNWRRRIRRQSVDYVLMPVGGPLPERAAPQRGFLSRRLPLWPTPALSMEYLNGRLQLIADADNVKGVLFIFRGFDTGLATIQNFRQSLERLREAGKESIVYTPYLNLRHYYAASAADRIFAPPGATFDLLGLYTETVFLKDTLQQVGVEVDVVQISPYKTAFDNLQHENLTPEYREQLNWLLDDQYEVITADIAQSRGMEQAEILALIDQAPHFGDRALELGLIDGLVYEDELANLLATDEQDKSATIDGEAGTPQEETPENGETKRKQADIKSWPDAYHLLLEKPRRSVNRFVGVISMEGIITMGSSHRSPIDLPIPFLGSATAGEQTIVDLLRRAERMGNMAALVFHVDSGGGVALAADFIGREIERIAKKIPVLVYMGNIAASGGYYVSAPAQHIMCQRSTTTGSIGVITMRPSTGILYEKLMMNRVSMQRGEHANLYSDAAPMSAEERQIFSEGVLHSYQQFKEIVARGRNIPIEELDPICEGRVWTGKQAQGHKLVDSHGDFVEAIRKAAELAELPVDDEHAIAVANLTAGKDGYRLPRPFEEAQEIGRLLSKDWLAGLSWPSAVDAPFSVQDKMTRPVPQ